MYDASPKPPDVREIIREHYAVGSRAYDILMRHGDLVARKALAVADRIGHLNPDRAFLMACAYLHDIGIVQTCTPTLGCHGTDPYIRHGVIGREMLAAAGLPRHALVCERHVGVGITAEEIRQSRLPLPEREMVPVTLEEEIICYADKFFSKDGEKTSVTRTTEEIRAGLARYGTHHLARFDRWASRFE